MNSDDKFEAATGELWGRRAARDCYSVRSRVVGVLVVTCQQCGLAADARRLEARLSRDDRVNTFMTRSRFHSHTLDIAILSFLTEMIGHGEKCAVIVTRIATCDMRQAFIHVVGNPMTHAGFAVV